jgi:glycosyltransferase involved in cell wall biosynthesis
MPAPLTVVIPTLNEGWQIAECVKQLAWAGEVIVADGGSTDDTVARARGAGAVVLEVPGVTIAGQRNFAIARAAHPWVFALDADERIGPTLAAEVSRTIGAPAHAAYAVWRRNYYLGRPMRFAGWGRNQAVRLFPRERRFVERRVHEGLEPVGDVGHLQEPLEHTPYRDLADQIRKIVLYSEWGARDLADAGRRARLSDVTLRPAWAFFRSYVLALGVLEGWRGLAICGLSAVNVFLKYVRLWDLQRRG